MNNPIQLQSSVTIIDPNDNNAKKELPNSIWTSHLSGEFSLSDYEDDDDDSGFCCPCCLPR